MAKNAQLEKKALAQDNKSEGMRMLLSAGYTVAEVKDLFNAPYGFVYGVATRANGGNPPDGAERRTAKAATATKATARPAKAASKPAAKAAAPARATRAAAKPAARTARTRQRAKA